MNPARTAYWKSVAGEGDTDERWHVVAATCEAFLAQRSEEARRRMDELRPEYEAAKAAEAECGGPAAKFRDPQISGDEFWVFAPERSPLDDDWFAHLCHNERRRTAC